MLQRPELFGAVVSGVPVADMVRFPKFTFGVAWKPEYGDPDKPDAFKWLMAYSPLHNVKPGQSYPPLMILTADNDQRVVPAHAYKMAATLRADLAGEPRSTSAPGVAPATAAATPSARPSSTRPTSSASCAPSSAARSWSCPRSRRDERRHGSTGW